jgi:hypothetical protein
MILGVPRRVFNIMKKMSGLNNMYYIMLSDECDDKNDIGRR